MSSHLPRSAKSFVVDCKPETFFLLIASALLAIYLLAVCPLTRYPHASERFLHVVHSAMIGLGKSGDMPIGFIELINQTQPARLKSEYRGQMRSWSKELLPAHKLSDLEPEQLYQGQETLSSWLSRMRSLPDSYSSTVSFNTRMNPAMYTAIGYFPFILVAMIGLLAGAKPIAILYAGILLNAIISILAGYFVIRIAPSQKWLYVFILLLPSVCLHRVYVMPDSVVLWACLLFIAIAMHLKARPFLLTMPMKLGIGFLALLTGVSKNAYFLVPLVGWLIPLSCFHNEQSRWRWLTTIMTVTIVTTIIWNLQVLPTLGAGIPSSYQGATGLYDMFWKVLAMPFSLEQLLYWMNNIFLWNISAKETVYNFSNIALVLSGCVLLGAIMVMPDPHTSALRLGMREKWMCAMIFFATMFVVIAAVSLNLHRIAAQGRYFLPVWPLLAVMFYSREGASKGYALSLVPRALWLMSCLWGFIIHYYILSHFGRL